MMKIRTVETIEEFKPLFGFGRNGAILETDLDVVQNDCDLHGRKRHDAEVLCTLAANASGPCLDLGTSHGRSAFKLATNLQDRGVVFTVNLLPEQHSASSGQLVTHLLTRDQIGSFYRERGLKNVTQVYADTASWIVPEEIQDLAIVFVDAAHDTERVYRDSKKIYDLVRPGGYICWHDFSPECRSKYDWVDAVMRGVERFVAETIPDAEIVHLRHSWMGVLRKPDAGSKTGSAPAKVRLGLVLEKEFHDRNRWTTIVTPALIDGILGRFDIRWIQNQADYEAQLGDVEALLSFEAGWGAPVLELTRTPALRQKLQSLPSYMFYSDPHGKKWREDYVLNGLDFALAFYDAPTRHHFRRLPSERLVHFPWAIPDSWIGHGPLVCMGAPQLTVFGAGEHEAYALRNWCRTFPFVESCANSGCENKAMTNEGYLQWLASRDAIVAAGSDDPRFRLTTPKYFEIAAIGALLFAQETDDLEGLGFRHRDNCIVFNRSNFESLARDYLGAPGDYLDIRSRGRELIRRRHALSVRLDFLENHMTQHMEAKNQSLTAGHATPARVVANQQSATPSISKKPALKPGRLGDDFVPRIVRQEGDERIVAIGGLQFRLHPERYLDRELVEGRLFEGISLGLLDGLIRPGQTAVDVGANFGYYTLLLSRWVGENGRVIAFEPTREYGQRNQAHVRDNRIGNVRFEPLGLSDRDHTANIQIGECSATMHWTDPSSPRGSETIRLIRLDDWWSRYVAEGNADRLDFLKIDVDGHELQALRGGIETLRRHRPILLVEFYKPNFLQAGYTCADLADFLECELGYALYSEQTGKPFDCRAAFLAAADRPDLSVNVFCIPDRQSAATEVSGKIFTSPAELYLASADRMDRVLPNLARLRREIAPSVDTYATVIGGLSGLNYLTALTPKRILFYDINPVALDYARLMLELIGLATGPRDFMSRVFSRKVEHFLDDIGEPELTVSNQERYLAHPVDEALLADTLARLSPTGRGAYRAFVAPHLPGGTLEGVRNCRRLLPCWPANQRVPVGGGAALGCNEAGQLVPNTNTFFFGLGWLESPGSFALVQRAIAQASVSFMQFDLLNRELPDLAELSGSFILHVSNIDDWFPGEWPRILQKWQAQALAAQCRLSIISSHNGLAAMQADPHAWAFGALAPQVLGRVVEVTHKVPWGFHEFVRTNVTVQQYLAIDSPADTTILHILLGEGVARADFLAAYRKAAAISRRVIVLEHNRDSSDWAPRPPAHFVNEPELRELLLHERMPVRLTLSRNINGEKDDRRNMMLVLDSETASANAATAAPAGSPTEPKPPSPGATPQQSPIRRLCPKGKPRVLLIADVPNWIFARHCRMLERFLGGRFDFTLQCQGQPVAEDNFDLIYPLEWNLVPPQQIRTPAKYVTGVRSHLSWGDQDFLPFMEFLAAHFQRVHVVSKRLQTMFEPFLPSVLTVTHGVDTEFFTPLTQASQSGRGKIRIGWAGNRVNRTKGFEQYVAPLAKLPGVELVFCGFLDKNLNVEAMRDFHDSLDAYVCASSLHHEGNNNSLMEAAAMRRAIVTTDNGAVPEYLRNNDNAIIIDRELPNFIRAVIELRDDPARRLALGERARLSVQRHFEWRDMAEHYAAFFDEALARRDSWKADIQACRRFIAPPVEMASPSAAIRTPELPAGNAKLDAEQLKAAIAASLDDSRWHDAAALCRRYLKLFPDDSEVLQAAAHCFERTGDMETARLTWKHIRSLGKS
jgi:FkbM family methyltransferase